MESTDFQVLKAMNPVALTPPRFSVGQKLAPLARATIFVRDISRSLVLYQQILGMQVMFDHLWTGDRINSILGRDGLGLRAVVLMSGVSAQGNLGLYQLTDDRVARAKPVSAGGASAGDFALVFPTNNIVDLTREIEAAGYEIVSPVVNLLERLDYAVQPAEMMFRDDDGILVNLVQAGVRKGFVHSNLVGE